MLTNFVELCYIHRSQLCGIFFTYNLTKARDTPNTNSKMISCVIRGIIHETNPA